MPWVNLSQEEIDDLRTQKYELTGYGRRKLREMIERSLVPTLKPLPDDDHLRIFWQVAVTSAIEGQGEPYKIFATSLYHYLVGTYDHIKLGDPKHNEGEEEEEEEEDDY